MAEKNKAKDGKAESMWNDPKLKELKSAKKGVDLAIRMFRPANVTSILDRDTFVDKLAAITQKLENYIEKAEDVIEELEKLRDPKVATETEFGKYVDEINSLTEDIIKKVHDNESEIKKKIEKIIAASEDSRDQKPEASSSINETNSKAPQSARKKSTKTDQTEKPPDHSSLSDKIAEYCETGPFLTNLPEFIYTCKFIVNQYQKKNPIFG